MRGGDLEPGIYDTIIDAALQARLESLDRSRLVERLDASEPAELPERLGEIVGDWVREALAAVSEKDRVAKAIALSAEILALLERSSPIDNDPGRQLDDSLTRLVAINRLDPTGTPQPIDHPLTPLRDTVLLANAPDQPSVGSEIAAEVASADAIDIVLAFIRWSGIRDLIEPLRRHTDAGKPLRVITTTYTSSTERRALDELVRIGAHVRVSYNTSNTRLHAKAWHFHRNSGFSTVYIGSSNLTFSAQVTGLEWNVRAAEPNNPELIDGFSRLFSTYWADSQFEPFNPDRFDRAIASQKRGDDALLVTFAIEPYPFQRQILERLEVERQRGRNHNLVVAATGTGKTVVAALDYRRLQSTLPRARLLFVAHRSEILRKSRDTFRHILNDGSFGELWVDGERPTRWDHVFASIQSLTAGDLDALDPEHFDVVVVDEFHHAAAKTYTSLLEHIHPKQLLGLTATPERTDGLNILRFFDDRMAVELRLWDALEQHLLCPFHYYAIHDGTDLSKLTWHAGRGYDRTELANLYTTDDFWVSKVLAAVRDKVGDPTTMRALGFGVSIAHCEFLADRFTRAGIKARVVSANTPTNERREALADLGAGRIQVIFSVDVFNEGIDIPKVDVVLMLRPTESATVFLQQLGRGLRHAADKDVCTVLDFVGHQAKPFRFDLRYRRMLGRTRSQLEADIKGDFPFLPAGCKVHLDEVAAKIVLANIRDALPRNWNQRLDELRLLGDVTLADYLEHSGLDLDDVYANNHTFTEMRRKVGFLPAIGPDDENVAGRGLARLLHIDDLDRLDVLAELLGTDQPPAAASLDERRARQLQGLALTVFNVHKGDYASLDDATSHLWRYPELRHELLDVFELLGDNVTHLHQPLQLNRPHPIPLQVHGTYTREEILAGFGISTVDAPLPLQAGVYWDEASQTDLFFVTLRKAERDYSPTTRYRDYAISDELFHWESQSITRAASKTGQRYIHHEAQGTNVVLFVRLAKKDLNGRTMPYFCAGRAHYVEHRSERPMQITWRLEHPLPGDVFTTYRAAVA